MSQSWENLLTSKTSLSPLTCYHSCYSLVYVNQIVSTPFPEDSHLEDSLFSKEAAQRTKQYSTILQYYCDFLQPMTVTILSPDLETKFTDLKVTKILHYLKGKVSNSVFKDKYSKEFISQLLVITVILLLLLLFTGDTQLLPYSSTPAVTQMFVFFQHVSLVICAVLTTECSCMSFS